MKRAALLLLWVSSALGHGGGLDGYGCHHDRKRGGYHCHRGEHAGRSFASQADMLKASGADITTEGMSSAQFGACGSKRVCAQMTSCEEARHHLTVCGLGRLDGDGDGVPCESLCR